MELRAPTSRGTQRGTQALGPQKHQEPSRLSQWWVDPAQPAGQVDDPVAFERRFGPDLSRVGSKLRPEWIYRWVRQPHDYNPATRMPSLRLTTQEALDITAYLGSLEDDSPAGERVPTVRPQSEARDRTLMAYLTQRMIPDDARAKLDSLSERDRDVMLGERSIQRYGCFGCHLIPGFETTPPIGVDLSQEGSKHQDRLFFGFVQVEHTAPAWFFQKLKHPRSFDEGKVAEFYDRLRMPHFGFTDEQADAITLVLQGCCSPSARDWSTSLVWMCSSARPTWSSSPSASCSQVPA